ncbi:hypothetical protein BMS3Abin04_02703 [bacterium BMS3Abin04]|nr:hypothetical protein BMS3Abin04_02703 [bacterium BMS3Abin04]
MNFIELKKIIINKKEHNSSKINFELILDNKKFIVFSNSVRIEKYFCLFVVKENNFNFFTVVFNKADSDKINFSGEDVELNEEVIFRECRFNHENSKKLQTQFSFLKPKIIGLNNSFGFGDRLGIANAGHLRSLAGFDFEPVLAQQSIRELTRTQRKPSDVMDAAVFACLQEGWTSGFGADADHLKTKEDIQLMLKEGYTFFTFDPSDFVNNYADTLAEEKLNEFLDDFGWGRFETFFEELKKTYCKKKLNINNSNLSLEVSEMELKRALVKYGNALLHIKILYEYLLEIKAPQEVEVEISIDETESVTSAFEHYFIADQLHRLGIDYISLAPRFIGDFEKGIDYKGDIQVFEDEFKKHVLILKHFGDYKLSLHSGSDKFTAYKIIAKYDIPIHIKTAGTSYLEALRTIASVKPDLFREILDYSRTLYNKEKRTYRVSASVEKTKPAAEYSDTELLNLLNDDNARQILHVTYGRILTDKNSNGEYLFKEKLFSALIENQDLYDKCLTKHFIKHLSPFKK